MSIGRKLTVWIVSVSVIIAFISAYLHYHEEKANNSKHLESLGRRIGEVIEVSLERFMLTRDMSVLNETLEHLGKIEPITGISIINNDGITKISSNKKLIDPKLRIELPKNADRGIILEKKNIFRWVQPVSNGPACHRCHSPELEYLGDIVIDFSLEAFERDVRAAILEGFLIIISTVAVIVITMLILTNKLVSKRLTEIMSKIKRFQEGDYNERLLVKGNDELTDLAESFNNMASAINERDREKDILFSKISSSHKMWQETFDSITDLISIHDKDFNIVKANRAFAEHFGLHPRDAVNRKCYEVFHGTDMPVEGCPHTITLKENRPEIAELMNFRTNRIFRIATFPFYFHETGFVGSIHIARDITEEKEKEMKFIMTDRLAALGQMASGIAHEINNPLASIAGCAEGLLNRVKEGRFDQALFDDYLNIIEEEITRCKDITVGMLSFVREKTYEKKKINLVEALDKTLEIISFQGRLKGIKIARNYMEGVPPVYGSEGELRQIFMALITNSLDAMKDSGTLTLKTGAEGGNAIIEISDTGAGIPADNIGRIFTPFFTTKSEKGGTGLGLSIARKIIHDNKGTIDVRSDEGKGSTFRITFPA